MKTPAVKKRKISDADINPAPADVDSDDENLLITLRTRILLLAQEILHLNANEAEDLTTEYLRFMHLKKDFDEEDGLSNLAPSSSVDDLWHAHLLDTMSYRMMEIHFGCSIHHNPIKEEQPEYSERLSRTKKLYMKKFYATPPDDIWSDLVENEKNTPIKEEGAPASSSSSLSSSSSSSNAEMTISVRSLTGKIFPIVCCKSDTIQTIKERIQTKEGIATDQQRIIYNGKQLEDEKLISDCNIVDGCSVHLVKKLGGC